MVRESIDYSLTIEFAAAEMVKQGTDNKLLIFVIEIKVNLFEGWGEV
jgi:hypothetical protein